jgi:ankyrin repeat protein
MKTTAFVGALFAILLTGCHTLSNSAMAGKDLTAVDKASPSLAPENNQVLSEVIARKENGRLQDLIKERPDIPTKTFAGTTLLFTAAFFNNTEAAQMLIDGGADVNFTTALGERPLDRAQGSNADAVAELLKKHGAKNGPSKH